MERPTDIPRDKASTDCCALPYLQHITQQQVVEVPLTPPAPCLVLLEQWQQISLEPLCADKSCHKGH